MAKETEQYPIVDYELFRNILTTLADTYPERLRMSQIPSLVAYGVKNAGRPLCYLREQGLIAEVSWRQYEYRRNQNHRQRD